MFLDDYQRFLELGDQLGRSGRRPRRTASPSPTRSASRGPFVGLELEKASFVYPGTVAAVLHDVDLRIEPGEIVALVGENGSGKTTLVKLICQLYQPQTAACCWNGVDAS